MARSKRGRSGRRVRLAPDEVAAQQGAALPTREAMSLVTPVPGDGALQAMASVPDGTTGQAAVADHAPVYSIQPVESEPLQAQ